jgi:hypothetical protein
MVCVELQLQLQLQLRTAKVAASSSKLPAASRKRRDGTSGVMAKAVVCA